jgi:hypothetical protein
MGFVFALHASGCQSFQPMAVKMYAQSHQHIRSMLQCTWQHCGCFLPAGGIPCLFTNGTTNTTACNIKNCTTSALSIVQIYQVQTPTSCPAAVVQALAKTLLQAFEKLPGIVDGATTVYPVCKALAASPRSLRRQLLQVSLMQHHAIMQ